MTSVLVTGAKRGIALGLVKQFAEMLLYLMCLEPQEYIIILLDANPTELNDLVAKYKGKVHFITMDPADTASTQRAAKDVQAILGDKGLDILINNAGTAAPKPILETTPALLKEMFDANVVTAQNVTVAFFELLKKGSAKKVVNISTLLASITETDGRYPFDTAAYGVSKAALNMLTKWYAKDFGKDGFTFIALSPGYVKTDLSPDGMITVAESASGIIKVTYGLTTKDNGTFYSYDGSIHPW